MKARGTRKHIVFSPSGQAICDCVAGGFSAKEKTRPIRGAKPPYAKYGGFTFPRIGIEAYESVER